MRISRHSGRLTTVLAFVVGISACGGDFHMPWRDQKLPSGKTVKLTELHLAWGDEHGERDPTKDDFEIEFVATKPGAPDDAREAEAREVFELIRPTAELWAMNVATVSEFPSLVRKGKFDFYIFRRNSDGSWRCEHEQRKVFSND